MFRFYYNKQLLDRRLLPFYINKNTTTQSYNGMMMAFTMTRDLKLYLLTWLAAIAFQLQLFPLVSASSGPLGPCTTVSACPAEFQLPISEILSYVVDISDWDINRKLCPRSDIVLWEFTIKDTDSIQGEYCIYTESLVDISDVCVLNSGEKLIFTNTTNLKESSGTIMVEFTSPVFNATLPIQFAPTGIYVPNNVIRIVSNTRDLKIVWFQYLASSHSTQTIAHNNQLISDGTSHAIPGYGSINFDASVCVPAESGGGLTEQYTILIENPTEKYVGDYSVVVDSKYSEVIVVELDPSYTYSVAPSTVPSMPVTSSTVSTTVLTTSSVTISSGSLISTSNIITPTTTSIPVTSLTPPTTSSSTPSTESSINKSTIIIILVAIVIFILILVLSVIVIYIVWRRSARRKQTEDEKHSTDEPPFELNANPQPPLAEVVPPVQHILNVSGGTSSLGSSSMSDGSRRGLITGVNYGTDYIDGVSVTSGFSTPQSRGGADQRGCTSSNGGGVNSNGTSSIDVTTVIDIVKNVHDRLDELQNTSEKNLQEAKNLNRKVDESIEISRDTQEIIVQAVVTDTPDISGNDPLHIDGPQREEDEPLHMHPIQGGTPEETQSEDGGQLDMNPADEGESLSSDNEDGGSSEDNNGDEES